MDPFEFHEPTAIEEACDLLGRFGDEAAVLAGGTALLIDVRHGERHPRHVISLWNIPGLGAIHTNGSTRFGTLTTVSEVARFSTGNALRGLGEAARALGSWQVQNMATIGGNLCKASPGADLVPPLLCLDADLEVRSVDASRWTPLDGFLTGPDQTALSQGEVLTTIRIPEPPPRTGSAFLKVMRRQAVDCSIVSVCARVTLDPDGTCREARIGLAAVAPHPFRAKRAEAALLGRRLSDDVLRSAARWARQEATPISDVRASAAYRRLLVGTLVERTLGEAARRAGTVRGGQA
jgi:carbon-monoxide dehydrogenase medium subunit